MKVLTVYLGKIVLLTIALSLPSLVARAQFSEERTRDLGSGFRAVVVAEPSSSSFESIAHREYLFYEDRKLGSFGEFSLSPSGNFAIYQDAASGKLFLFRRSDEKVLRLNAEPQTPIKTFVWHEERKMVEVRFEKDHPPQLFPLQ